MAEVTVQYMGRTYNPRTAFKLSPSRLETIIGAVVEGKPNVQVAMEAGIRTLTLYRWLSEGRQMAEAGLTGDDDPRVILADLYDKTKEVRRITTNRAPQSSVKRQGQHETNRRQSTQTQTLPQ